MPIDKNFENIIHMPSVDTYFYSLPYEGLCVENYSKFLKMNSQTCMDRGLHNLILRKDRYKHESEIAKSEYKHFGA